MNTRISAALLLAAPLAGCISFGAKPPPALLTLTATAQPPVGQDQSSAAARSVTVEVPAVPQALATARVPVQTGTTQLAYVPKAQWSEPPARLFARLLGDTLTARTGRVVTSGVQAVSDPGARLGGELRRFGLDADARVAVVTYDAALIRGPAPGAPPAAQAAAANALEKRRFEARVPVAAINADAAAAALNDAANQVAAQVADWVGR